MIKLTRLNHSAFCLSPDMIERIEETPDTIITLANGNHYVVLETAEAVVEAIVAFRARIAREAHLPGDTPLSPAHQQA